MKTNKLYRPLAIAYCIVTGALTLLAIASAIADYPTMEDKVPMYLAPWGGAWGVTDKSLFYAMRMPVMAMCLQGMLLGLCPKRVDGWPEGIYSPMRMLVAGLSLITVTQLTLNPVMTIRQYSAVPRGILLCALTLLGLALSIKGYLDINRCLKPMRTAEKTTFSLLIDFLWQACSSRRVLMIASVTAFMVLLVIPSLSL